MNFDASHAGWCNFLKFGGGPCNCAPWKAPTAEKAMTDDERGRVEAMLRRLDECLEQAIAAVQRDNGVRRDEALAFLRKRAFDVKDIIAAMRAGKK